VPHLWASLFLILSVPSFTPAYPVHCRVVGYCFCVVVALCSQLTFRFLLRLLTLCYAFYCWAVVDSPVSGCFCFLPHRCNHQLRYYTLHRFELPPLTEKEKKRNKTASTTYWSVSPHRNHGVATAGWPSRLPVLLA
jgi:hypothetical protein